MCWGGVSISHGITWMQTSIPVARENRQCGVRARPCTQVQALSDAPLCWQELSPRRSSGVSLLPPSLPQEDDSQHKAALPLPWLESRTDFPV